ncbi:MAG: hypothetical protein JO154_13775 [Chitinophaga sp.]|uniref:hypothetical protein n=1 Tax=Chitinophaga sp. TaxID=1869181 RepID=UPI0025C2E251|nr:hypothetical protein [Chitinophaga sp.]MBV8253672.1 hypothetical protein [Chitinophaga sp.]
MKTESATLEAVEVVTLHSIHALHNLPVSHKNKIVNPHHLLWTNRKSAHGKATPVVFDINKKEENALEVKISFSKATSGNYTLEALSDTHEVLFSGKVTSETVICKATQTPEEFATLRNHILHWQLVEAKKEIIPVGTTWIPIYWTNTKEMAPSLYRKGINLEALEAIATATKAINVFPYDENTKLLRANAQPVSYYVDTVFNYIPPRYDVWHGATFFTNLGSGGNPNNITLYYNSYVAAHNNQNSILNCYDTASVLQYYLNNAGYSTQWLYMNPFGYLKLTPLIGRGMCNNPFYASYTGGQPQVNVFDKNRTAFGNHAFVKVVSSNTVADACAGPHRGNETAAQYVAAAVDTQYPNPPRVPQGTVNNITPYIGVTHVNTINAVKDTTSLPHLEAIKKILKYKEVKTLKEDKSGIAFKWPEPADCPVLHGKWKTDYEEIVPGAEEVVKIFMLNNGEHTMNIKLHVVSATKDLAHNRFLTITSFTERAEPSFEAGPEDLGEYCAVSTSKHYPIVVFILDNVVMQFSCSDPTTDLIGLAKWFHQAAQKHEVKDLHTHLPAAHVHHSSLQPKLGDRFYLSLSTGENAMLEFDEEGQHGLQLISEEDSVLVFDTVKAGKLPLKVLVVDKDTLLVNTHTIHLDIQK